MWAPGPLRACVDDDDGGVDDDDDDGDEDDDDDDEDKKCWRYHNPWFLSCTAEIQY